MYQMPEKIITFTSFYKYPCRGFHYTHENFEIDQQKPQQQFYCFNYGEHVPQTSARYHVSYTLFYKKVSYFLVLKLS